MSFLRRNTGSTCHTASTAAETTEDFADVLKPLSRDQQKRRKDSFQQRMKTETDSPLD